MKAYGAFGRTCNLRDFPIRLPVLHPVHDRHFFWGELIDALVGGTGNFRGGSYESQVQMLPKIIQELHIPSMFGWVTSRKCEE
jgi:hypothetical protein